MYNFYPGPSKIHPSVRNFANEAFESGILEKNHRSDSFMKLLRETITLFKAHLNIPADYSVFFTSSATEGWEICGQSILGDYPINFFYNGAFGEKWMKYSQRLVNRKINEIPFDLNDDISGEISIVGDICFVINETSNGTHIDFGVFPGKKNDGLILVDAVSSMGGVDYPIHKADVWITSSQKCLGLPSGMGIMILSPEALFRAKQKNENSHYNSLLFIEENFNKYQTPYTPNILAVYLLKRSMESSPNIRVVSDKIHKRAKQIYERFENEESLKILVENNTVRSPTVICLKYDKVNKLINYLQSENIIIGKGYGHLKDHTVRIANFPAILDEEYDYLFEKLHTFVTNL